MAQTILLRQSQPPKPTENLIYSPELPWAVSLVAPPSTFRGDALLIRQTNTHLGWDLQFSTGFIKGPKKRQRMVDGTEEHSNIWWDYQDATGRNLLRRGWEIPPQLLGSCSTSIAINRLIDSLNWMPLEPQSPDWVSIKALPTHVPREGWVLQAVLLLDTSLPGVWRNIIMFLALGHTGLRPSIKLRSDWKRGNEKDPTAWSHQP